MQTPPPFFKKAFSKIFYILLINFILTSFSSWATTYTVNTLTDEQDNSCADADCSLRDAIRLANSNADSDSVIFSVDGTFVLSLGEINITKNITITGNGQSQTILDGQSNNRAFKISQSAVVSLNSLTIQNSFSALRGGAIHVNGVSTTLPELTLNRVSFKNNRSTLSGGALSCVSYGRITVIESEFLQNQAGSFGGAITNENCPQLNITKSLFQQNSSANSGGAIYNATNTNFTVSQSLFNNNTATNNGGAIYNTLTSQLTLTNSTLAHNTASSGGAIYNYSNSVTYSQSNTITLNTANGTNSRGGGIYNYGTSTSTLKNTILTNNSAVNAGTDDCYNLTSSSLISNGYNFIPSSQCTFTSSTGDITDGQGLTLETLSLNSGVTQTMAIDENDVVYNTGSCSEILNPSQFITVDQRDVTRGSVCDMGAYEHVATWYQDLDGDGFGNSAVSVESADQPTGYVDNATDCDDNTNSSSPNAVELCHDNIDNNCDGTIDENTAIDATTWHADTDADTYGSITQTLTACSQPLGYVANDDDCDDSNSLSYLGATEICDNQDNDCDGAIDEFAQGQLAWYADQDHDGYGTPQDTVLSCFAPSGYIANNQDCNDTENNINPSSIEICDTIDNNCSGSIDENLSDVDNDSLCDALDSEVCDGQDNDGDAQVDESGASGEVLFYQDNDADGFGNMATTQWACSSPSGFVGNSSDCDDTQASINTLAQEICDGQDNDCDGNTDEAGATNETTFYQDNDQDSFGNPHITQSACQQPQGYVSDATDCNDTTSLANPSQPEVCDQIDNNCDAVVDEDSARDATTWFQDADSDTFGDSTHSTVSCEQPTGYVLLASDCDDQNALIYPTATELCSSTVDLNCDGQAGSGDADGDGFQACEDCNDANASINASAQEICDGADNNCNGAVDESGAQDEITWYQDADSDTFGSALVTTTACVQPSGFVASNSDCDDTNGAIRPGAVEVCDGLDNNCDGSTDPQDALGATLYYTDQDGDGFGSPESNAITQTSCTVLEGFANNNTDCNDADANISPAKDEICANTIDDDCNSETPDGESLTWFIDTDGDGYGDSSQSLTQCGAPVGYVEDSTDCNDTRIDINGGALEICDKIDNDCDNQIDEISSCTNNQDDGTTDGDDDSTPDNNDTPGDDDDSTTPDNTDTTPEKSSSGGGCSLQPSTTQPISSTSVVLILTLCFILILRHQKECWFKKS